ncbi:hypothetical protein F0562_013040 [Nyssa sinensis]|uniref:Uncharacterized protein n=1 Tax=Nyssa sinensis TaxID=561372 RepID=A0A5J4ZX10_9ASTE|nr:hypothetical protein F0562_013040 [Nyssa sinensis]
MESSDTSFSLSSLLCKEDESCLNEDVNLNSCSFSQSDDEYIHMLIRKETSFISNSSVSREVCSFMSTGNWLKCARLDAIKWILHTRAIFGFHFRTAYLSLTYFDRFLSRRFIDNGKLWAIRLLSVACLSLAAKMEESKVPALSQYQVDDFNFESNVIQRMELLVLNTLKWKMGSITPFHYLHYFITKFFGESRPKLISRAIELILAMAKEINLMDHRPAIIAAAAVLAASDGQFTIQTVEFKMGIIPSWGSLEKEHIYSCYNLMQEIGMGKCKTPNSVVLSAQSSSNNVFENSSITSAIGSKRRLTYNDCDQHCPLQKLRRP